MFTITQYSPLFPVVFLGGGRVSSICWFLNRQLPVTVAFSVHMFASLKASPKKCLNLALVAFSLNEFLNYVHAISGQTQRTPNLVYQKEGNHIYCSVVGFFFPPFSILYCFRYYFRWVIIHNSASREMLCVCRSTYEFAPS